MTRKQHKLLLEHLYATPGSEPVEPLEPLTAELLAVLRRDWDTSVLDAWAAVRYGREVIVDNSGILDEPWYCSLDDEFGNRAAHYAITPVGARELAARAMYGTLPESVQRDLGPRP
jgi:hypothetical protein